MAVGNYCTWDHEGGADRWASGCHLCGVVQSCDPVLCLFSRAHCPRMPSQPSPKLHLGLFPGSLNVRHPEVMEKCVPGAGGPPAHIISPDLVNGAPRANCHTERWGTEQVLSWVA